MKLTDEGWGGGELGPILLFNPLWYSHFISSSHRGVRTRKNGTKSDACLTMNLCKMEDETFPSIDPIGADSHDSLYEVSKLLHDKCLQPLSQINQHTVITEMRKPTEPVLLGILPCLGRRRGAGGNVICSVMEPANGMPYRLPWQGLLCCELMSSPARQICHHSNRTVE